MQLHCTLHTSGDFLNWFRKSLHRFAAFESQIALLLGFLCWDNFRKREIQSDKTDKTCVCLQKMLFLNGRE